MRYLGNKNKLLENIEIFLTNKNLINKDFIFCDAFAGTATVADYFKTKYKKVITNDNMYYSYVIAQAKLNTPKDRFIKLGFDPFVYLNTADTSDYDKGFIYNNYAPTKGERQYFSDENAKIIDFIREKIEEWFSNNLINENEKYYLISCLLESVSKVSNIAGVYGAYLKIWDSRAVKKMNFLPIEIDEYVDSKADVYNEPIDSLISKIEGDVLYLDPPYTASQYSSQYHLLETIAKYDNPEIKGISGQRQNNVSLSDFSRKGDVENAFERLIANAKFKHIVLSYSSAGIMSKSYIDAVLKRYGKKDTYLFKKIEYKKYKNSRTDNESLDKHYEYLFYIEKQEKDKVVISSPLNYIGGKYDLIPFLKENMPKDINTFYDLFGGGCNVGLNINAKQIVYNDINFIVKDLLEEISKANTSDLYKDLKKLVKKYDLSKNNQDAFLKLRKDYNSKKIESRDFKYLILLITYGFQHQIRVNSKFEFNNPVGNSELNEDVLEKLISFSNTIKEKNITFNSESYNYFESLITSDDFVYFDPPYLITCGSYNDGKRGFNGWDEKQEKELLTFIKRLHDKNIKFMLSNVIEHKGNTNEILKEWIKDNGFKVVECDIKTRGNRKEVIIINY